MVEQLLTVLVAVLPVVLPVVPVAVLPVSVVLDVSSLPPPQPVSARPAAPAIQPSAHRRTAV